METKLARIAEITKRKPKEPFTSMYHLLNKELLQQFHEELDPNKATGVDQVTKVKYAEQLEENLEDLVGRLKRKGYRPQPARRTYNPIPRSSLYSSIKTQNDPYEGHFFFQSVHLSGHSSDNGIWVFFCFL